MFSIKNSKNLFFPATIILLSLIISSGIFIYRSQINKKNEVSEEKKDSQFDLRPITNEDKILGNPNADVIIVEYSDFECPFCKAFHQTMQDLMVDYGRNGKLAWVFRNFPIEKIHKNAKNAAIASECVFKIGGNEKFWQYSSILFSSTTEILSSDNLAKIAGQLNISNEEYNSCIKNPDIINKIENDIKEGNLIAKNDPQFGTPYSFLITKAGTQTKIIGAETYINLKQIIEKFI